MRKEVVTYQCDGCGADQAASMETPPLTKDNPRPQKQARLPDGWRTIDMHDGRRPRRKLDVCSDGCAIAAVRAAW